MFFSTVGKVDKELKNLTISYLENESVEVEALNSLLVVFDDGGEVDTLCKNATNSVELPT